MGEVRVELAFSDYQSLVLPLNYTPVLVQVKRFERLISASQMQRITKFSYTQIYGAGHRIRTCEAFATAYKAVPFDHFGKPAFFWWVPHFRYAISRFLCPSVMPLYEKSIIGSPER